MYSTDVPCMEVATVVIFKPERTPMCGRHGTMFIEDTDCRWAELLPGDGLELCRFAE